MRIATDVITPKALRGFAPNVFRNDEKGYLLNNTV